MRYLIYICTALLLSSCISSTNLSYNDPNYLHNTEFKDYDKLTKNNYEETNNHEETNSDSVIILNDYATGYENSIYYSNYSSRIKRFHRPMYYSNYYSGIYTDYYWNYHDPFFHGTSIYYGSLFYTPYYDHHFYYPYYLGNHYLDYGYNYPSYTSYSNNNYDGYITGPRKSFLSTGKRKINKIRTNKNSREVSLKLPKWKRNRHTDSNTNDNYKENNTNKRPKYQRRNNNRNDYKRTNNRRSKPRK